MRREFPADSSHLLRLQKVAQVLDCSVRHVYSLCAQGLLDRVSIGSRSSRVTRESLARLLADARTDAKS